MSDLPRGWVTAPIGTLCLLNNGRAFKPTEWSTNGLPIVRIQNLNDPEARFNHYSGDYGDRYHLKGGELLFAWSGTPGTSFGAHVWQGGEALLNQHIFRVDLDERVIERRFFRYAINQKLDELIGKAHGGVGLRHVTKGKFEQTEIALPPRAEQARIADKLDSLFAKVGGCQEQLDRVPQILKRFRQAVLEAAVSGRLTEEWREETQDDAVKLSPDSPITLPISWRWLESQDAVEPAAPIIYGILQPGPDVPGGLPYIQGVDVSDSKIFIASLKRTTQAIADRYSRSTLAPGDVVLCIIRNIKVAIVPPQLAGANISRTMARLRPSHAIRSKYLALALESPYAFRWFQQFFRGIDMPGLNLRDVRRLPIPLPTLEEQDEIIRRVDKLVALADRLGRRYRDAMTRIGKLTPSILSKAFRGEMVPQDPNDEPAEKLLETVRGAPRSTGNNGKPSIMARGKIPGNSNERCASSKKPRHNRRATQ